VKTAARAFELEVLKVKALKTLKECCENLERLSSPHEMSIALYPRYVESFSAMHIQLHLGIDLH
jgi:hypothetical protein